MTSLVVRENKHRLYLLNWRYRSAELECWKGVT
jgi:hypothetical protein